MASLKDFYKNTLTGAKYLDILSEMIIPEMNKIYQNRFNRIWWLQDGALVHGSRAVREFLQGVFTERIISHHHAIEWPPRSLDLIPCDYFLWGHFINKVYSTLPDNTGELRGRSLYEVNLLKENKFIVRRVNCRRKENCNYV